MKYIPSSYFGLHVKRELHLKHFLFFFQILTLTWFDGSFEIVTFDHDMTRLLTVVRHLNIERIIIEYIEKEIRYFRFALFAVFIWYESILLINRECVNNRNCWKIIVNNLMIENWTNERKITFNWQMCPPKPPIVIVSWKLFWFWFFSLINFNWHIVFLFDGVRTNCI